MPFQQWLQSVATESNLFRLCLKLFRQGQNCQSYKYNRFTWKSSLLCDLEWHCAMCTEFHCIVVNEIGTLDGITLVTMKMTITPEYEDENNHFHPNRFFCYCCKNALSDFWLTFGGTYLTGFRVSLVLFAWTKITGILFIHDTCSRLRGFLMHASSV